MGICNSFCNFFKTTPTSVISYDYASFDEPPSIEIPESIYKLFALKTFINNLPDDSTFKKKVLQWQVTSCNYDVYRSIFTYKIRDVYDYHSKTNLLLGEHLQIENIVEECEIGLTKNQELILSRFVLDRRALKLR